MLLLCLVHFCLAALVAQPNKPVEIEGATLEEPVVRYFNGRVLRDHRLEEGELWVSQGKIVAPHVTADVDIDVEGAIIAPGYIDLQLNGGFGIDFSMNPERVGEVADRLPRYGVTAFLPTLISSTKEQYERALKCLRSEISGTGSGASILGVHLEGPFFCPKRRGAHNPEMLLSCEDFTSPEEVYGSLEGVKIVTLAPELRGAGRMIAALRERGIVISAGHSSASCEQMDEAIGAGIGLATHLFNMMSPFHHRDPGIIGAILTHDSLPFLVIGDRYHLHPKTVELAWKIRPDGLILVTDAMAALGLESGIYHLGTMEVEVMNGKAVIKGTETLAGSVVSLDSAVRYLYACSGCSKVSAIEAASWKPAKLLGIETHKGTLQIGSDADFILLDDDLRVLACFIGGVLKNGNES